MKCFRFLSAGVLSAAFLLATTLAPASASVAPAAGPLQRLEIDRSAAKTHPCGYNAGSRGGPSKLSDFRIVTLTYKGKEVAQLAFVAWRPSPDEDVCDLLFVRKPGDTLKSLATRSHPFVEWAPMTWGTELFIPAGPLNKLWRQWFTIPPPNWLNIGKGIFSSMSAPATPQTQTPLVLANGEPLGHGALQRRPAQIIYSGDGAAYLGGSASTRAGLSWTSYTQDGATAVGADWRNDCVPDCADGTFHAYPSAIRVFHPEMLAGHRVFTGLHASM